MDNWILVKEKTRKKKEKKRETTQMVIIQHARCPKQVVIGKREKEIEEYYDNYYEDNLNDMRF